MVEITTLENTDLSCLTEAWNRCWQGYFYEMIFTEENLRIWLEHGQIDFKHCIALQEQDKIVGFTFLSQMNFEGWIAGTAIDPCYRGKKLFAPMIRAQIDLARSLGIRQIYLEVLSQNFALHTYQAQGFRHVRELNHYRLTPGTININHVRSPYADFHQVDLSTYFLSRKKAGFVPSWQRRAQYLKRYVLVSAWLNSQETAGVFYGGVEGKRILDAWAAFDDAAQELLSLFNEHQYGEFSLINQPWDPVTRNLAFAGIRPTDTIYEMVREFREWE